MDALDFDALINKHQEYRTLNDLAHSDVNQNMTNETLSNIKKMQTPVTQGYIPQHVVLPIIKQHEEKVATQKEDATQFFVILNNQQKGPLTLEQLKGLAIADVIDENSQVWMTGLTDWTDLKTCLASLKK